MFSDDITKKIAAAAAQIKTEPPKNEVNTKSVEGAVVSIMANEELKGNQHKIDANKNGKIDAHDFKLLRGKKKVEEGVKGAGVGAALGSVAGGPVGAAIGGALGHVAGEVLSSAKNKAKAMGRIAVGPSMADSKMKKEDVEQIDEVGDTSAGRKMISSYVNKAIGDKSKDRSKGLRKATSRLYKDNFYGKKNEEVEMNNNSVEEGVKGAGVGGALGAMAGGPVGAAIGGALGHVAGEVLSSAKNKAKAMGRVAVGPSMADSKLKKEETELDEGFPTVADAKKRMASKESPFEKKKISTGTVYTRKYKEEPDEDLKSPSRRARDSAAVLAQAKADGKIRNDKGVAKPASQGVKMEEVEQIDELVGKGKLPSIAAYHKQKSAEAKGKMETVRSSNTKLPVPKATSAKIFAKDAEAKYHSTQAKRADALMKNEEVELEMYDADEINNVQIDNIDERSLTSSEMNKREEIVKSMKKGIQGFKDRYGDRAKNVMYATAAKIAKEKS